ncbi:MAG: proton-conducting transporter membrane subunit [Kiritimatiellia bacterium]
MEHVPYIPFAGPLLQWPVARTETGLLAAFALLGGLTLIYALPDIRRGFLWAALIHVVGGILSLVAADLIMLLLGWELMTFSAFFIFTRERDADSLNSGLRYIVMHMGAAVLFFVGAAWQWQAAGSLAVTKVAPGAQLFFLGAILIKTAVMPLHFWLVDAYPRAGFAGSVLLAAYATKVGIFTAARLLNYLPGGVPVLSYIGALVAVAGAFAALRQCQARKLLAYHIVSQLGYMLAGVGLASASGAAAGLFHALNNVIYKSLLLMVAGVVCRQYGHEDLRRMGGAARRMPLTFCACLLAAAAIAGLPPMAGYASKELLKQALTPSLNLLLWLASLGTALSFIKFVYLIFLRRAPEPEVVINEAGALQLVPMLILAAVCVLNGVWPGLLVPGAQVYAPGALLAGLLPILAALLLWQVAHKRLARQVAPADVTLVMVATGISRMAALLPRLRAWHDLHPQTAFMLVFWFWLGLAWWLGGGRPV